MLSSSKQNHELVVRRNTYVMAYYRQKRYDAKEHLEADLHQYDIEILQKSRLRLFDSGDHELKMDAL